ncbi:MAG: rhodanese-like domain-containing protein [Dysgonomonas sp.]
MSFFNNMFHSRSKIDFTSLLSNGAILLDVRTKEEYRAGHVENSINIPVDDLSYDLSILVKDIPIITVCASGMRSSRATNILSNKGYEVYNGGSWTNFK